MAHIHAPFSIRYSGQYRRVDNSFPDTARIALLHLLCMLVKRRYVDGWPAIAGELQRIGRKPPSSYVSSSLFDIDRAKTEAEAVLNSLEWEKVYDFCERLYSHLPRDVGFRDDDGNFLIERSKSDVQKYISDELERIFLEEGLAFEFSQGLVRRRGRKHTVDRIEKAQTVLGDDRLVSARKHYVKALQFFCHPTKPDYENSVKEAVCAVEAAGKSLFPAARAKTLGDLTKWFQSTRDYEIPMALIKTIESVYAYRSSGDGVSHGSATGGAVTAAEAEYILSVSASQIIYLVDVVSKRDESKCDEIPI